MNLSALAGNDTLKGQLTLHSDLRGLSHAYILSGPAGSGRHTLAGILAAALVCTAQGEPLPCGRCTGCRKALSGIHPDVIRTGEVDKDITVAQVRALRSDAYIRPNEAERKVYLLENAHTMNDSAQNALLKLLEEGPPYAAFLLLCENADALLPTVRSRCQCLSLSPLTPAQAEAWLTARYPDKPPQRIREAAQQCEGLLGRAVIALEGDGGQDALLEEAAALLACMAQGSERTLAERCVALEKWDRDQIAGLMDALILLLRDGLVHRAGGANSSLPPGVAALPPQTLLQAVEIARRLRAACASNVGAGHLCGWLCAALSAARPSP